MSYHVVRTELKLSLFNLLPRERYVQRMRRLWSKFEPCKLLYLIFSTTTSFWPTKASSALADVPCYVVPCDSKLFQLSSFWLQAHVVIMWSILEVSSELPADDIDCKNQVLACVVLGICLRKVCALFRCRAKDDLDVRTGQVCELTCEDSFDITFHTYLLFEGHGWLAQLLICQRSSTGGPSLCRGVGAHVLEVGS